MRTTQELLEVQTNGRGFTDVTRKVAAIVARSGVRLGLCQVFVKHTSASLLIQENADPAVLRDFARWLSEIAPESSSRYEHDDEGPDDMPAHLRSGLTRTGETIPVRDGALALGTWQAIYLCEHRSAPHRRTLVVTVLGSEVE
jgi:secondary thiamine-phosphate synthase enzyme